jgi:hypothetical protein
MADHKSITENVSALLTRRLFLRTLPAAGAAVALPVAAQAIPAPLSLHDRAARVHDLAEQTADAFDAWNSYVGGSWELRIRAADDPCPIIFYNIEAHRETRLEKVARLRSELIQATKALYPEIADWRVLTPESEHCGDTPRMAGMFMIVGHRRAGRS